MRPPLEPAAQAGRQSALDKLGQGHLTSVTVCADRIDKLN